MLAQALRLPRSLSEDATLSTNDCFMVFAEVDQCYSCRMPQGCLGGSLCAKGFAGTACSECDVGYYELLLECHKCSDNALLTVVILAVCVLLFALAVYRLGVACDEPVGFLQSSVSD